MQRIISVHEAAHAVVAWLWNVPFTKVRIIPDLKNYMLGHIEFTKPLHQPSVTPANLLKNIASCKVLVAGAIAEEKILGHYGLREAHQRF